MRTAAKFSAFICGMVLAVGMGLQDTHTHNFSSIVIAADPAPAIAITMPPDVTLEPWRLGRLKIEYTGKNVSWEILSKDIDSFREYDPATGVIRLVLQYNPPMVNGKVRAVPLAFYVVGATAAGDQIVTGKTYVRVNVPEPTPEPDPPGPDPKPPTPPPGPSPIPADGLHVLILYETGAQLTIGQRASIFGGEVRSYLNSKCPKIGNTPQYRIYDKDIDTTNESKLWQDAVKRAKGMNASRVHTPATAWPWIIVSTGKGGFEGPLPATMEETLALLKKFGG